MLRSLATILILVSFPATLLAQKAMAFPRFTVVKMADKLKYSKDQLNKELQGISSKDQVKKLLKAKQLTDGRIVFKCNKSESDYTWWTVNLAKNLDIEDDHIVLQTRNVFTSKFYKLDDFKSLFRDSLVLVDTLAISLYIHNTDYPDDAYLAKISCGTAAVLSQRIPLKGNLILFTPQLVAACEQTPVSIAIVNTSNPERTLAACKLVFLQTEDLAELEAMGAELMVMQPGISHKEISANLSSYIHKHYGNVYLPQLNAWITRTLRPAN